MGNFTAEQMEKAKAAKSVEELLVLAKENGVEMTEEEAGAYYAQLHPTSGEMADDELENVAGGGCHGKDGRLVVTGGYSCDGWEMNYYSLYDSDLQLYEKLGIDPALNRPHNCCCCKYFAEKAGIRYCDNPINRK